MRIFKISIHICSRQRKRKSINEEDEEDEEEVKKSPTVVVKRKVRVSESYSCCVHIAIFNKIYI